VGKEARTGGLAGKRPGTTRKAIFSKGRGLRVRDARPFGSRGTSSLSTSWPEAGCLAGTYLGEARAFPSGVRSPPLRGGALPRSKAFRGKPGDNVGGDFLGGARSPRPQIRAGPKPGHVIATHGSARGRWPKGGQYWVWRNAFLAGVRSPPLRRVDDPS
jgi:hypothetical protein